jgi:Flp pilus assembly protein TadG
VSARLHRLFAILRREEGSNMVEMAISSTVLFAMLFGVCQMSIAFYAYNYVSDAARQATRYAAVRGTTSCTNTPSLTNCGVTGDQIQTWVQALHYPGIRTTGVTVTTTWCAATVTAVNGTNTTTWPSCSSATSATPGNMVKVNVSYPLNFTIPFVSAQALSISATSELMITQ